MEACNWDNPGANPFGHLGPVEQAIASYGYPDELARRIRRIEPDDVIYITRDGVTALKGSAGEISDMHYGSGLCKGPVVRSAWPADRVETALVYCHKTRCVAVPIVCGNISRIEWSPRPYKDPTFRSWDGRPIDPTPRVVSEPGTWALAAFGLVAVAVSRTTKARRNGCATKQAVV